MLSRIPILSSLLMPIRLQFLDEEYLLAVRVDAVVQAEVQQDVVFSKVGIAEVILRL